MFFANRSFEYRFITCLIVLSDVPKCPSLHAEKNVHKQSDAALLSKFCIMRRLHFWANVSVKLP